ELLARLLRAESAEHGRRYGGRMLLLDPTHHHAEMADLDDHADAQRLNRLLNRLGNLHGQTLLHLQTTGKYFHQSRDLAQTDHFALGNIGHMDLAEEWQHVVLTQAEHFDVLHDHHLVVVHAEQRRLQHLFRVFAVALGKVLQGVGEALRRLQQSLAVRLFAQANQHLARQLFEAGAGQGRRFRQFSHHSPRGHTLISAPPAYSKLFIIAFWSRTFSRCAAVKLCFKMLKITSLRFSVVGTVAANS